MNQLAASIVKQTTSESELVQDVVPTGEKNPAAVALGRLGGLKGGAARAKKLSKAVKSLIAKKAAEARWAKKQTKKTSS